LDFYQARGVKVLYQAILVAWAHGVAYYDNDKDLIMPPNRET